MKVLFITLAILLIAGCENKEETSTAATNNQNFERQFTASLPTIDKQYGGDSSGGGGGGGIVCRDAQNNILSVEMLDSFEATELHKKAITEINIPYLEQISNKLDSLKTNPAFHHELSKNLQEVQDKTIFLDNGLSILPSPDLSDEDAIIIKNGCDFKLIGFFQNDGTLAVSSTLFDEMSETQKAMFFFHEALYLMGRTFQPYIHNTSQITRRMVGDLFSGQPIDGIIETSKQFLWPEPNNYLFLENSTALSLEGKIFADEYDTSAFSTNLEFECCHPLASEKNTIEIKNLKNKDTFLINIPFGCAMGLIKLWNNYSNQPHGQVHLRLFQGNTVIWNYTQNSGTNLYNMPKLIFYWPSDIDGGQQ